MVPRPVSITWGASDYERQDAYEQEKPFFHGFLLSLISDNREESLDGTMLLLASD